MDIAVYAVWLPILPADAVTRWDADIMPDSRVKHYWDGQRVVGRWLADNLQADPQGIVFDSYWDRAFFFTPDAEWAEAGIQGTIATSPGHVVIRFWDEFVEMMTPYLAESQ